MSIKTNTLDFFSGGESLRFISGKLAPNSIDYFSSGEVFGAANANGEVASIPNFFLRDEKFRFIPGKVSTKTLDIFSNGEVFLGIENALQDTGESGHIYSSSASISLAGDIISQGRIIYGAGASMVPNVDVYFSPSMSFVGQSSIDQGFSNEIEGKIVYNGHVSVAKGMSSSVGGNLIYRGSEIDLLTGLSSSYSGKIRYSGNMAVPVSMIESSRGRIRYSGTTTYDQNLVVLVGSSQTSNSESFHYFINGEVFRYRIIKSVQDPFDGDEVFRGIKPKTYPVYEGQIYSGSSDISVGLGTEISGLIRYGGGSLFGPTVDAYFSPSLVFDGGVAGTLGGDTGVGGIIKYSGSTNLSPDLAFSGELNGGGNNPNIYVGGSYINMGAEIAAGGLIRLSGGAVIPLDLLLRSNIINSKVYDTYDIYVNIVDSFDLCLRII